MMGKIQMPIKAVLFDMFDTLVMIRKNHDFYSPSLMRMYKYLNQNGIDVSFDIFQKAYVKTRDELYAKAEGKLEEPHFNVRVAETLKSLGYYHDASSPLVVAASTEFCSEFTKFVYPDKDAQEVLKALYGKYRLGIVSNFAIPECVHELIKIHGLDKYIDVVVVSGAINKRKPSPEIFKRALKALGVSASETIFVGDTIDADIEGAKAVGMKTVYIERRIEQEIGLVQPDKTIKSLSEFPLVLENV